MFAFVENGIVKEVCRAASPFDVFFPSYASQFIECPDSVASGDTFDGTTWSKPVVDVLAIAKAARQAQVDAITVTTSSGKVFDGNEEAQRRMTSAITAMDDGDELPWVLHDNTVAVVNRAELREALRLAGSDMAAIWIAPYTQP